ncbi:hypothetical protein DDT54_03150 [Brenneria nigrifluens DSM 30175 = ATCC 13028]|uniref:Uncharacterized protein n=1 Tax=Brenneria nigrifluens DSM 30175 = ATCC 13028 TaxID=1121120 RepID=A0A2U1UVP0_9GAMM|nr:hypothetical protein DDT54_03150 [Brenneria nigrifluens DSM 30175 = ATCC 13028]
MDHYRCRCAIIIGCQKHATITLLGWKIFKNEVTFQPLCISCGNSKIKKKHNNMQKQSLIFYM